MYNPMYYLDDYYAGYKSSDVADYFRINTGITQGDTSNVVEMNLYLALLNYGKNATFTTVWNQGHTEAERSGDAEDNFISWIAEIESSNSTVSTEATTNSDSESTNSADAESTNSTDTESINTTDTESSNSTSSDDDPTKILINSMFLKTKTLIISLIFLILI